MPDVSDMAVHMSEYESKLEQWLSIVNKDKQKRRGIYPRSGDYKTAFAWTQVADITARGSGAAVEAICAITSTNRQRSTDQENTMQ